MTKDPALWWKRAAQSLPRVGLLWLALTAVALGSLVSTGAGLAPNARLIAASSIGSTGKLKANGSGAPTVVPGELAHRALNPDHPEAKRVPAGGTPVGLVAASFVLFHPASTGRTAIANEPPTPDFKAGAFHARAPPA